MMGLPITGSQLIIIAFIMSLLQRQTSKFGLCGECIPCTKVSCFLSVCAKFFERPTSAQIFDMFAALHAQFSKQLTTTTATTTIVGAHGKFMHYMTDLTPQ